MLKEEGKCNNLVVGCVSSRYFHPLSIIYELTHLTNISKIVGDVIGNLDASARSPHSF